MSNERFHELLGRLLDEELSPAELQEFVDLTKESPARLQELQHQMEAAEMIALSEDDLRDSSLFVSALQARISGDPFVSQVRSEIQLGNFHRNHRNLLPWGIAAAAVIALLASSLMLGQAGPRSIVEVVEFSGAIQWTGDGGKVDTLEVGQLLSGGMLESLAHDAWARLRFNDGTSVTVSGQTALTISEDQQKVLRLRHGNLSADVASQPTGSPLLVHTPTADLAVLGTQFNVDAQAETTMLTVNEGRVRLRRLTDGKVVDVAADHQAIASIDVENELAATPRAFGVSAWQSELERDVIHGKWVSGLGQLSKRLKKAVTAGEVSKADAMAQYKQAATLDDRGSAWSMPSPFGSFVLLRVSGWSASPVVATSDATIRVRGNLHMATDVAFGFNTNAQDGGFAGKYALSLTTDDFPEDGIEFDVMLSIDRFMTKDARFGASPSGKVIRDFWGVTKSNKAKFEITHLELIE